MNQKIFTLLTVLLLFCFSYSHAQRNCGTMQHHSDLLAKDSQAAKKHAKMESRAEKWIQDHKNDQSPRAVITIPVVVHVVWRTSQQNITDAQILSQITVLNEDFRRTNADANQTPAAFLANAADCEVEFCLAVRDPNGNITTGITRTQTTVNSWSTNDNVKFTSNGGKDAWPRNDYLNIWVCNMGGGILGYAQFPGNTASTDGVVIGYNYFGTTGAVSYPFNDGRTTTHEVGHWLGLYHIWGDDGGSCGGSDLVADTPNQANANYNCPNYPRTDGCTASSPGVMFMNYMDYTDDRCMNMFTNGQNIRMKSITGTTRASLSSSQGCVPVNAPANDAGVSSINSPSGTICATSVTPEVVINNFGTNTLNAVNINWQIDGGATQTQAWLGSMASQGSATVTLPNTAVGAGAHTITVWTTSPNNSTDGDNSNDSETASFTTVTPQVGQQTPVVEGFEGAWPGAGWTINNPDNATTWAKTNAANNGGSWSLFMDNFNYAANGEIDEFELPAMDLSSNPSPALSFDVAYKLYSASGFSDTLRVLISIDCGNTWNVIYNKFDQALTTGTPYYTTNQFVPAANEWRTETISLGSYAAATSAQIVFQHICDYENSLYVENINLSFAIGLEEQLAKGLKIYPNPNQGQFIVDVARMDAADMEIHVVNLIGEKVSSFSQDHFSGGKFELDLQDQPAGIYLVQMKMGDATVVGKVSKMN